MCQYAGELVTGPLTTAASGVGTSSDGVVTADGACDKTECPSYGKWYCPFSVVNIIIFFPYPHFLFPGFHCFRPAGSCSLYGGSLLFNRGRLYSEDLVNAKSLPGRCSGRAEPPPSGTSARSSVRLTLSCSQLRPVRQVPGLPEAGSCIVPRESSPAAGYEPAAVIGTVDLCLLPWCTGTYEPAERVAGLPQVRITYPESRAGGLLYDQIFGGRNDSRMFRGNKPGPGDTPRERQQDKDACQFPECIGHSLPHAGKPNRRPGALPRTGEDRNPRRPRACRP